MMVQSWEDLRSWSGARGQGESKTGWGALPERGKDLGLDSLLYHVYLPARFQYKRHGTSHQAALPLLSFETDQ